MFKLWTGRHTAIILADFWLLVTLAIKPADTCGPGRSYFHGRRAPRKMTPLVYKQHSPNLNENTLGASGPAEGSISRNDPEFKNLATNNNPDIVFKDEEGTGADRKMSQRCSEKLNALAILVSQRWPGVKLRVTEGWDEDGFHPEDSLHYEGRAVDITTSDRDRTKYGMLARLAIEAGFDWVHYESRGHIHCSVKSDSSLAVTAGGCFPGNSKVLREDWTEMLMMDLRIGDKIWTIDLMPTMTSLSPSFWFYSTELENSVEHSNVPHSSFSSPSPLGNLVLTEVITFLHKEPNKEVEFATFESDTNVQKSLITTANHLVYVASRPNLSNISNMASRHLEDDVGSHPSLDVFPTFAASVQIERHRLVRVQPPSIKDDPVRLTTLTKIKKSRGRGVYAPLTSHGTLLVNGYLVSCYATVADHSLAHDSLAPLRMWLRLTSWIRNMATSFGDILEEGVKLLNNFFEPTEVEMVTIKPGVCSIIINNTDSYRHDNRCKSMVAHHSRMIYRDDRGSVQGVHPYVSFIHWMANLFLDKEMLFRI